MHDRDRRAPEALAGQQPVTQPVVRRPLAAATRLEVGDDPLDGLGLAQAVVLTGTGQDTVTGRRDTRDRRVVGAGVDDHAHGQAELPGEVEVALVVRGHGHDRPGAVVGQHVVGGVDGHLLTGQRVGRRDTEVHAGLGAVGRLSVDVGELPDLLAVGLQRRQLGGRAELGRQRCVGRHDEEGRAAQGVRSGREHRDGAVPTAIEVDVEVDVRPTGPADPVFLHEQHRRRPVPLELLHVVEQPVGVLGDPEVPLRQLTLGDLGATALAATTDDLLVSQHRLVLGAPVDRRAAPGGQAPLPEAQEQPLGPAVVLRVGGVQPRRPVEADGVAAKSLGLGLDVGVRPRRRVLTPLDGGVLGRQPEGVPADGVQHVVPPAHPEPGDHVADPERLCVPHVQVTAGVAEHVDDVRLRGALTASCPVEVEAVPHREPPVLQRVRVVDLGLVGDRRHRLILRAQTRQFRPRRIDR